MHQHESDSSGEATLEQTLAEFRYQLRLFLQFSEKAAHNVGLQPQQHQLLLQVAGSHDAVTTIAWAAERLGLRHNSMVELVNRCVSANLLVRGTDSKDARRVVLQLTKQGRLVLSKLSGAHARELLVMGPALLRSLRSASRHSETAAERSGT